MVTHVVEESVRVDYARLASDNLIPLALQKEYHRITRQIEYLPQMSFREGSPLIVQAVRPCGLNLDRHEVFVDRLYDLWIREERILHPHARRAIGCVKIDYRELGRSDDQAHPLIVIVPLDLVQRHIRGCL